MAKKTAPTKNKARRADAAAVRGARRAAALDARELHLWRPRATRFADRTKVANRQAARGRVTSWD